MNCTSFEDWLHESAEDRQRMLPRDAARHLVECASCRARWAAERCLDAAIAEWRRAPLPQSTSEPILTLLLAGSTQPMQSRRADRRRVGWVTAFAALAALFVMGLIVQQGEQRAPTTGQLARQDTMVPVSDSVAALWNEVRNSSQAVARETVESLDELSQLRAAATPIPVIEPTEHATVSTSPWLPWSEPIRENVNSAFGFLSDAVPMPEAG